jgi:hypothetical protein
VLSQVIMKSLKAIPESRFVEQRWISSFAVWPEPRGVACSHGMADADTLL